jgi:hypothetical protein
VDGPEQIGKKDLNLIGKKKRSSNDPRNIVSEFLDE